MTQLPDLPDHLTRPVTALALPRRRRGRITAAAEAEYQRQLAAFCAAIIQIASTLDFDVSARGWCYILEEHGLKKGEFDDAEKLIAECRKSGLLPIDIVAEDSGRSFENVELIDNHSPAKEASDIVGSVKSAHENYFPFSLWNYQSTFVQMLVEKVDLRNLFDPVCAKFNVPIANVRGWGDINTRAALMRRYRQHEMAGRKCVLLYCGDHDPAGLSISAFLRSNLEELEKAVGWSPKDLTIDRFGLNADFIAEHGLTWIDNLETGSGKNLADPSHPHHRHPYVQNYIRRFGARKVEANALVVRPEAGRELCRDAIERYVDLESVKKYRAELKTQQSEVADIVKKMMAAEGGAS
jgi:hypothetical protein